MSESDTISRSSKPHSFDVAIAAIPHTQELLASFLSKAADAGGEAARRRSAFYRVWPLLPHEFLALGFWRSYAADDFCDRKKVLLESVLGKLSGRDGHDERTLALGGDSAAAIAAALTLPPIRKPNLQGDLVMSAVLRAALAGCPTSTLVLSHVLRRATIDGRSLAYLAHSWGDVHQTRANDARWLND